MLTPLLTVKSVTPSATLGPSQTADEKQPVAPKHMPQTGQQRSEAALRILETLNRHLVGTETLPKEALLRLLDTLSRLLKVQALPQESIRDFGRRIAVVIEALPPAARQALEKQLGQRNLALSVRILGEIVKALPITAMPQQQVSQAMPQPTRLPITAGQIIPARHQEQSPSILPPPVTPPQSRAGEFRAVLAQLSPLQLPAQALTAGGFDAGALQAVLKSAFLDEPARKDAVEADQTEPEAGEIHSPDGKKVDRTDPPLSAVRLPTAEGKDPIPALHTVTRFLAENPDALDQVIAMIGDDIDEDLREAVQQVLETDTSLESVLPAGDADVSEPIATPRQEEAREAFPDADLEKEAASSASNGNAGTAEPEYTIYDAVTQPETQEEKQPALPAAIDNPEKDDPDLSGRKSEPSLPRGESPLTERAARIIADALKTLIDVGMPLSSDGLNEPLEKVFAGMAPTEPETTSIPLTVAAKTLTTGGLPILAGPGEDMTAGQDMSDANGSVTQEGRVAARLAAREDVHREPLPPALPETTLLRETLPFLAMPITTKPAPARQIEEEEASRRFDQNDEQDGSSEEQPRDDDAPGEQSDREFSETSEDAPDEADAYGFYHRP
jgi:hypothetical protein